MSYDLDTLIAKFRRDMEDTVEPYLWSEDEVIDYIGQAEDEFCQEVDAIADELVLNYTASDVWLDIPYYVTRFRSAEDDTGHPVELFNHEEWSEKLATDDYGMFTVQSDWKSRTGPRPTALITDSKSLQFRFYPIPTADGSITVNVFRRPLKPLEDRGVLEVKDRQHQRAMLLKARALAYMKHDAEAFNADLAQSFEQQFAAAIEEIKSRVARSRRRARPVAYGGL